MHILFLTDNFPPEVNAPASRTFEHCREWVSAGHDVTVITCAPNFPKGRVFDGYKNRWRQEEFVDGIRVIRVWSFITANEGFLKRTLDYLSFMISAILASGRAKKVDIIIATSPQFFTAVAGFSVSILKRCPWIFELRDLWPDTIRAVGAMSDGPILDMLERLELFLYKRAQRVVAVTHAFKRNLVDRGIVKSKIAVVTNGADLSCFRPLAKDPSLEIELGLEGRFVAGYIGTHGMCHALDTLLEAASQLKSKHESLPISILMLGDGAEKARLKEKASALGLDNVIFIDSVPKSEVHRYWSLCDVSIIHLRKTDLFKTVIPSKLFEGMAMGIPVIHCVEGESAEIVRSEGIGVTVEPENADALTAAIMSLYESKDLRRSFTGNALQAAPKYDRVKLAQYMLMEIEAAANRTGGPK